MLFFYCKVIYMGNISIVSKKEFGERTYKHYEVVLNINDKEYIIYNMSNPDYKMLSNLIEKGAGFKAFNFIKHKYKVERLEKPSEKERKEVNAGFEKLKSMFK